MIVVNDRLMIPDNELQFTFARSSGPGGQNVNKVNSKALLRWNVVASPTLPVDVRRRFLARFRHRVTADGDLLVTSQRYRDQPKNVADCCEKVAGMLREVLQAPKRRRATKPTRGSRIRRLQDKRQHGTKKQRRRRPDERD
jgi:ribosome-associated protein